LYVVFVCSSTNVFNAIKAGGIGLGERLYFVAGGEISSRPKTVVYRGVVTVIGPLL